MTESTYNDIAEWYDEFLRERPIYTEVILPNVLALINISDLQATFQSVARILRPGGWFVFAIPHPCFQAPHAQWTPLPDREGALGRLVHGYFEERWWLSENPNGVRSRVADRHRMFSTYLNHLADTGFVVERCVEPRPSERQTELVPGNREVPTVLLIRARLIT